MRRFCLSICALGALVTAAPAHAADVLARPGPAYVAAPVAAPAATGCWLYGALGWGWYPCHAGPPAYWHTYRYGWRPYWARHHRERWVKWGYW